MHQRVPVVKRVVCVKALNDIGVKLLYWFDSVSKSRVRVGVVAHDTRVSCGFCSHETSIEVEAADGLGNCDLSGS